MAHGTCKRHNGGWPMMEVSAAVAVRGGQYLPIDIIMVILLHLRVKDLLRFKCVCKSWHDMISGADFINLHLDHAKSESSNGSLSHMTLAVEAQDLCCRQTLFYGIPMHSLDHDLYPYRHILYSGSKSDYWHVVDSCDGLVCLESTSCLVIWNPSTRAQICTEVPVMCYKNNACKDSSSYGFGYNHLSHDYKVVRRVEAYSSSDAESEYDTSYGYRIQVYSVKANAWRCSSETYADQEPLMHWSSKFIHDDAIYWCVMNIEWREGTKTLVRYDLEEDQWSTISLPPHNCREHEHRSTIDLEDHNGRLCLLVLTEAHNLEFWTLTKREAHENKRQPAWNKILVLPSETLCREPSYFKSEFKNFLKGMEQFRVRHWVKAYGIHALDHLKQKLVSDSKHYKIILKHVTCVESLVAL